VFVSCCSCFVLHLLESSFYNLVFFFTLSFLVSFFSRYSSSVALFVLFFSHCSFGVAPCIVLLALPFFALSFLLCCNSFGVDVPFTLQFFLHCCSFHATLPTLQLSRCSSHVALPMLPFSHYSSHATLIMLLLSCCNSSVVLLAL
jgi:hypothetical protein